MRYSFPLHTNRAEFCRNIKLVKEKRQSESKVPSISCHKRQRAGIEV